MPALDPIRTRVPAILSPCRELLEQRGNVREFAGRYREGVARGELHEKLRYRFDFQMAPLDVVVTLFYDQRRKSGWVFVRALSD